MNSDSCHRLIQVALPTLEISAEVLYRHVQYPVQEDCWSRQGEEVMAPNAGKG